MTTTTNMNKLLESFVRKVDILARSETGMDDIAKSNNIPNLLSVVRNYEISDHALLTAIGTISNLMERNMEGFLRCRGAEVFVEILDRKAMLASSATTKPILNRVLDVLDEAIVGYETLSMRSQIECDLLDPVSDTFPIITPICALIPECTTGVCKLVRLLCKTERIRRHLMRSCFMSKLLNMVFHHTDDATLMSVLDTTRALVATRSDADSFCEHHGMELLADAALAAIGGREDGNVHANATVERLPMRGNVKTEFITTVVHMTFALARASADSCERHLARLPRTALLAIVDVLDASNCPLSYMHSILSVPNLATELAKRNSNFIYRFIDIIESSLAQSQSAFDLSRRHTHVLMIHMSYIAKSISMLQNITQSFFSMLLRLESLCECCESDTEEDVEKLHDTLVECAMVTAMSMDAIVDAQMARKLFALPRHPSMTDHRLAKLDRVLADLFQRMVDGKLSLPFTVFGDGGGKRQLLMHILHCFFPTAPPTHTALYDRLRATVALEVATVAEVHKTSHFAYCNALAAEYELSFAPGPGKQNRASGMTTWMSCPLSLEDFRYPVTASDGHTYELEHILMHAIVSTNFKSPMTREQLSPMVFVNRCIMDCMDQRAMRRVSSPVSSHVRRHAKKSSFMHAAKSQDGVAGETVEQGEERHRTDVALPPDEYIPEGQDTTPGEDEVQAVLIQ